MITTLYDSPLHGIGQFYVHRMPTHGKPQGAVRFQNVKYTEYSLYWIDTNVYLKVKY